MHLVHCYGFFFRVFFVEYIPFDMYVYLLPQCQPRQWISMVLIHRNVKRYSASNRLCRVESPGMKARNHKIVSARAATRKRGVAALRWRRIARGGFSAGTYEEHVLQHGARRRYMRWADACFC